jgi:hypothetical protein
MINVIITGQEEKLLAVEEFSLKKSQSLKKKSSQKKILGQNNEKWDCEGIFCMDAGNNYEACSQEGRRANIESHIHFIRLVYVFFHVMTLVNELINENN